MSLNFSKLSKSPKNFLHLTGVSITEFRELVERIRPDWELLLEAKKCDGRTAHLATIEDQTLCTLLYYRTYNSQEFLGFLFDLHESNVCRLLKKIEPLLAKKITIKKDRSLTPEKIMKLITDATEIKIQRPKNKNGQKKFYSGKKKTHTIKSEMTISEDGKIISVSKTYEGRVHDFTIKADQKPLPRDCEKHGDLGYQGWHKLASNVFLPIKKKKHQPLTKEEKLYNRSLASFRVKIEHKFRELKIFKILSGTYRNFRLKLHMRLNIIAGIVNLKHAF